MIGKIEARTRRPTFETVVQLALALEFALGRLLKVLWDKVRSSAVRA